MPSRLNDQVSLGFHTTSNNTSINPLALNYLYINEKKISRSLICSICLNPLVDPCTHIQCENSFCNRCISKLKYCSFCQTSIDNTDELKNANHVIRNLLDELQVQCNICKQILCRGNFEHHIENDCLEQSLSITDEQNKINQNSNEYQLEKHFSNLYQRAYKLENELNDLKKVIALVVCTVLIFMTFMSFGAVISYLFHSFLSSIWTLWIPLLLTIISNTLWNLSPFMIFIRLIVLILCFWLFSYENNPSNINILSLIIYSILIGFNLVLLAIIIFMNYYHLFFFIFVLFLTIKYFYLQIPNNFLAHFQDQINIFFCHSFNQ